MRVTILAMLAALTTFVGCGNEAQSQIAPSGASQKLGGYSGSPATASVWKFVNIESTLPPYTGNPGAVEVPCPKGYIAISGGYAQIAGKYPTDLQLYWNGPTTTKTKVQVWTYKGWIDSDNSQGQKYDFLAICTAK